MRRIFRMAPRRRIRRTGPALSLALAAALAATPGTARAQIAPSAASGGGGVAPLPGWALGATVGEVRVEIRHSGGSAARDGAVLRAVRTAIAGVAGSPLNPPALAGRLQRVRARTGAAAIDWRLLNAGPPTGLVVLVEVDTTAPTKPKGKGPLGGLLPAGFPMLYQSNHGLVTAIAGGGFGFYSDGNPWFGKPALFNARNPLAGHLPGGRATWTEGYLEFGLGTAFQLGDSPVYAYGALTGMATWSLGQDIFRNDARLFLAPEKAYAGILYAAPDRPISVNLSVGRQSYTLNDGFLVHMVRQSTNAGDRGALYLGPRLTSAFTVLADVRLGRWRASAFYIEPDELSIGATKTRYLGANVGRSFANGLLLDATAIGIPASDGSYVLPNGTRRGKAGLVTLAGHVRWRRVLGLDGVWIEGELAHQSHSGFPMSAWAWYALLGYRSPNLPWHPSISYRYAYFSGDDPSTATYERFDPLMSTGLGYWLQGISFGKLTANSNLIVHRVQANLEVSAALNLTFEYFRLLADQQNNLGSNPALAHLASDDLGQELTFSIRWAFTPKLFFQGIASIALPGRAFEALGATAPWSTLQASLYWTF